MQGYIIPNLGKANSRACTFAVARVMEKCGITAVMPEAMQREFPIRSVLFQPKEQGLKNSDFIIAIGGDGTILHIAQDAVRYDVPVLGINAGRVGFLATIEREETELIAKIASGDYQIENRMLIEASVGTENCWAVNDIVLTRGEYSRIVDIDILCDGNPLYSLRGDGVILATPTGSTAYSLSAGGPVLDAHIAGLVVTPICAHSLHSPSMVFSAGRRLRVSLSSPLGPHNALLSCDGRSPGTFSCKDTVDVSLSDKYISLICFNEADQFEAIDKKLKGR